MAPFKLITLPKDPADSLYTDKDLGFCWAAFHCSRSKDFYQSFSQFKQIPVFRHYFDRLPAIERELIGRYLGWISDRSSYSLEEVVNLVITNNQEKEIFMQSVAQEYVQQGIQQGVQQGMQQGIREGTTNTAIAVAKNMFFKLHLDIDTVHKATELPKAELEKLLKEKR